MRIGTRGSALALAQSAYVRGLLPGGPHEVQVIETSGDRHPELSLQGFGGKGIFTKEIEQALLESRVDLAVHSLKDLPTDPVPGLTIAALLTREDPRDAWIARDGKTPAELPAGSRVGTSSLRRRSQILARRPDFQVVDLRGNVPTRITRLKEGRFEAIVVAAAGLNRLGLTNEITEILDEAWMLPAPGQGILAVQIREGDATAARAVKTLHDPAAAAEATAERELLAGLGGGCLVPVGARARARDDRISIVGFVGHPSGRPSVRSSLEGPIAAAAELGRALASTLLAQGAREILEAVRGEVSP
jgi:hydroxymethylbilane synthase